MVKKKSKVVSKKETRVAKPLSVWIQHGLAILGFLLLSIAFFYPQLQGKKIVQGDVISFQAASHEIQTYAELDGKYPLWTNSMFGGMPSVQILLPTPGNRTSIIEKATNLFIPRPIGYFISMMIGFYLMCLVLGTGPLVAFIGSAAFAFTVNHLVLFEAGHMTKLRAFAFFGIMIAGLVKAYRGEYLLGSLLFALGTALEIGVNHIQMPYYLALSVLVYVGLLLYRAIRGGEFSNFLKASIFLLVGLFIGVACNTSRLWTTSEYAQATMRGKPILTKNAASASSSSEVEGLAWDYAMQWSNGAADILTYAVPGIVGGSNREIIGNKSSFAAITGQTNSRDVYAPLYWGSLPFTSGPSYVGAIVLFLFILGAIIIKGDLKWWLVSTTILTLVLSLGKNAEWINHFLFDYLPLYNKFRTPNSIASITEFLMILLATLTLSKLMKGDITSQSTLKKIYWAGGITGGFSLLLLVMGSSIFSFTSPNDGNYDPRLVEALIADRKSLMQSDALRSLFFILSATALLHFYLKGKLKKHIVLIALGTMIIIDVWTIGRRYVRPSSFVRPNQAEAALQPRQVDEFIKKDNDLYYRVLDLSVNTFNSSIPAYHHKLIGGYHPAKLQRYQDIIDYYLSKNDMQVLNMLNAKYIIDQQGEVKVNMQSLGNAWFITQIRQVNSANEEIDALQNMDPGTTAVIHQEFADYQGTQTFQPNGSITLQKYHPDRLEYKSNSTGDQFAVFSEVWYGPDKGWNAFIDGQPVDFARVNYILRGMKIPAGEHTIVFEFEPRSYYTGEIVSNIASITLILLLIIFLVHQFKPIPILTRLNLNSLS